MHSNLVVTGCDDHQFRIFDTRIPSLIADSKGKEGNGTLASFTCTCTLMNLPNKNNGTIRN